MSPPPREEWPWLGAICLLVIVVVVLGYQYLPPLFRP